MSKLNYELDQETINIIIEFYKKAKELDIGNVSFKYYATSKAQEVEFYLEEYNFHWELIVKSDNKIDVYKIKDDIIDYEYSEGH